MIFRVVLEKQVVQYYLVEANSQEEATLMTTEGLMLTPDLEEDISTTVVDVEKVE